MEDPFGQIKEANRKVRLLDILRQYGLKIEKNYQRPKWSNNITCPLPGHKGSKERTPSFGYCFTSDHFHCFGCGKTGKAVEFISLYENLPRNAVAERIISKVGSEDNNDADDAADYKDDISPILIDAAKYFHGCILKYKDNPKKMKSIHKILWWIDFYIMHKKIRIIPKDLQNRIDRAKELLDEE